MLLVFGVRDLAAVVATGSFHCPGCGGDRHYRQRRPRAWFHVFSIPLLPLRGGTPYVECRTCAGRFPLTALDVPTSARLEELLWRGSRTAVAYVLTGLGAADVRPALGALRRALGPDYTPEMLAADLAAHREGSDLDVLGRLAPELTPLGKDGLLRGLADLVLALDRAGDPDWRRVGDVAAALAVPPTHLRGILGEASSRARE